MAEMILSLILLIGGILALPYWAHSRGWGYYPAAALLVSFGAFIVVWLVSVG